MKIKCAITEFEAESDEGYPVPALLAECGRCSHETTSFGTSEQSIRRCLALMREECPRSERNFYVGSS